MIYNNLRHTTATHPVTEPKTPSLCPYCSSPLLARKGNIKIHHWAHFNRSPDCPCNKGESEWHYAMKMAYGLFNGWEIEYPLTIKLDKPEVDKNEYLITEKKFIIDSYNNNTQYIREMVHSLSPYYVDKHLTLKKYYNNILWIWDGAVFGSLKADVKKTKSGSYQYHKVLKPAAFEMHQQIGGIVHIGSRFFDHWKNNIWYPINSPKLNALIINYNTIITTLSENNHVTV